MHWHSLSSLLMYIMIMLGRDTIYSNACDDFDPTGLCDPNDNCRVQTGNSLIDTRCNVKPTDFECRQLQPGDLSTGKTVNSQDFAISSLGIRTVYTPDDIDFYDFYVIISMRTQDLKDNLTTGFILELESSDDANCLYKATDDRTRSVCHFLNISHLSGYHFYDNKNNIIVDDMNEFSVAEKIGLSHTCISPEVYPGSFFIRVTSYPAWYTTEYHVVWNSFYDDSDEAGGVWIQPVIALSLQQGNKIYAVIQEHREKFKDLDIFLDLRNKSSSIQKIKLPQGHTSHTFKSVPSGFYQVVVTAKGDHCKQDELHCPDFKSTWIHVDNSLDVPNRGDLIKTEDDDGHGNGIPREVTILLLVMAVGVTIIVIFLIVRHVIRSYRARKREHYVLVINLEQGKLKEQTVMYFTRCIPDIQGLDPKFIKSVHINDLKLDEIFTTKGVVNRQNSFFILQKLNNVFKIKEFGKRKRISFGSTFINDMYLHKSIVKTIVLVGFEKPISCLSSESDCSETMQRNKRATQYENNEESYTIPTDHGNVGPKNNVMCNRLNERDDNDPFDIDQLSKNLQKLFRINSRNICSIKFTNQDFTDVYSSSGSSASCSPVSEKEDVLKSLISKNSVTCNNSEYTNYKTTPKKTESIFSKINHSYLPKLQEELYSKNMTYKNDENGNVIDSIQSFSLPSEISTFLTWLKPNKSCRRKRRFNDDKSRILSYETRIFSVSMADRIENNQKWRAALTCSSKVFIDQQPTSSMTSQRYLERNDNYENDGSCFTIPDEDSSVVSESHLEIVFEDDNSFHINNTTVSDGQKCLSNNSTHCDINGKETNPKSNNISMNHTQIFIEIPRQDDQSVCKTDSRIGDSGFHDGKTDSRIGDSGFHDGEDIHSLDIRPPRPLKEIKGFSSESLINDLPDNKW